jgi:hypothetical protein
VQGSVIVVVSSVIERTSDATDGSSKLKETILGGRHGPGRLSVSRWCFARAEDANAFAAVFGGIRVEGPRGER